MRESLLFVLNGKPRTEILEGREYLVVPMVMITEGVHEGSNGKIYYPKEENAKSASVWNHKPIVVYHPTINGMSVTACDPVILESRKVGIILNTTSPEDGVKLKAEAWLEKAKLALVDSRVVDAINAGEVIEVSTGLYMDVDNKPGVWNNQSYDMIAKNYRPDHLAILPDEIGACSRAKGAGLNTNQGRVVLDMIVNDDLGANRQFAEKKRKELAESGKAMKDGSYPIENEEDLHNAIRAVGRAKNPVSAKKHIIRRAVEMGHKDLIPESWKMVGNMGMHELHHKLHDSLANHYGCGSTNNASMSSGISDTWSGYIDDIYPSYVIYWHDGGMFSAGYNVDHTSGKVGLKDEKHDAIRRVTNYQREDGSLITANREKVVTKDERVKAVITANIGWVDADKDFLTALADAHFEKIEKAIKPVVNVAPPVVVPPVVIPVPVTNQQQTVEQYIAAAPAEVQQILLNAVSEQKAEKTRLVALIVANKANTFTQPYLESQSVEILRGMVTLFGQQVTNQNRQTLNYQGQATVPPTNNQVPEPPLKLPDFGWKK